MLFVAFKLAAVADERRLGRQGQHLCFLRHPVVVHALGVLGVTHKPRHVHAAFNFKLVTDYTNDRNPFTQPFLFLKNFVAVSLNPFDAFYVNFALADWLKAEHFQLLRFGRPVKRRLVAGIQIQRLAGMFFVEILRNTDRILVNPLRQRLIAYTTLQNRRNRL